MDDLLRPNQSFPNASASGPADRPNTLDVQDANTDIFDIDDFDSPTELAAIQAGCDLSKMRAIGFSQNTLANTGTLTHNHNRARGPGLIAAADLSPSPHERPRSTLPNFAATGAGGSDEREVFESAPPASVTGAHSSAVVHLKRPQSRPLSSAGVVAGDSSPARPRARTFAKRSVEENPNIRRLEELYRDIAAQKELTARLGSSLRLHADEFDDSLSGRSQSQSLSSTPPLCFLPLEQSHSSSPSTSHSRDSPIQFVSAHIPPPPPGSAVVSTVATSSSIPRSASASSPDSPLSSSLSRPGGPLHPSGRKPSIDSPSPLAAPPLETRTLRPIADAANKNCVSSREPNYECVCNILYIFILLCTVLNNNVFRLF